MRAVHPPPLLPCNPDQPVGPGANRWRQHRVSNWLAAAHLYSALTYDISTVEI